MCTYIYIYEYKYKHKHENKYDHTDEYQYTYTRTDTHTEIYTYMGWGISPPAFCDISKSHELKQLRVKGLGYMSLGFRLPNFPNNAGPSGLGLFGKLGNWEFGKYVPAIISQLPDFPNSAEPDGLRSFGKLGSTYLYRFPNFPSPLCISAHSKPPRSKASDVESLHNVGTWVDRVVTIVVLVFVFAHTLIMR